MQGTIPPKNGQMEIINPTGDSFSKTYWFHQKLALNKTKVYIRIVRQHITLWYKVIYYSVDC